MNETEPYEIELTPDLLEYAKAVTIIEAKKHCPDFVIYDDLVQEVWLKLISKPPKFDPSMGASEKTLLYTVVQRIVLKHAGRERRHASRFKQVVEPRPQDDKEEDGRDDTVAAFNLEDDYWRAFSERTTELEVTESCLEFIDDMESRALCRLVMECDGNVSEAARRIGLSEGAVRHRLKLLRPKLSAAGFDQF